MPKSKLFSGIALIAAIALTTNGVVAKPAKVMTNAEPTVVQLSSAHRTPATPVRDDTEEMTLRWMYSSDGGENWSGLMDAGTTGMIDTTGGEQAPGWGAASYDFGAVADANNNLHFVVVLDGYLTGDLNPLNRVNGVYDVKCSADGETVSYNLIAAEGDMDFVWSDCGINAAGEIYAIWVSVDEDMATIYGSKSANGANWSAPFTIKGMMDVGGATAGELPYPHMTTAVGENNFYIMYQAPSEALWAHHVLTVPSSLSGEVTDAVTGAASAVYFSYYIGSSNPIAMDPVTGDAYFCNRNENNSATAIGYLTGPGQWSVSALAGAQRYPSVGLDTDNEVPFIFSNNGPGNPHRNWFAYDGLGYNGGDWTDRMMLDSVVYEGARDLLYCHQGVWTSEGRLVSGVNVWGQFTPEGFQINYSDDGGETWAGPERIWSIFDEEDAISGGFIAQNILVAGADNHVFVAYCGKVGATDFDGPEVSEAMLVSFSRENPFHVMAGLSDLNGIGYADINWRWTGDMALVDSLQVGWEYAEADSATEADALGNGTYHYTMPNDTMQAHALADGDSVWFFLYAEDPLANTTSAWENLLIVGREYQGVWEPVILPTKTELGQNYPNPFNNSTVIPFALSRTQDIKVQVWDTNGRLIRTVFDGRMRAGSHEITWNTDGLSSGIYVYTLETKSERFVGKMSLLH